MIIKRILRVSVFIIIFVYLFIHVSYIFREPLSHTREHTTGFYAEKDNTVDVIVIGTSCTFSAIAPMQLWGEHGIPAYDLCTNVMLEESMKHVLREAVKTQDPELVIIDIAPFMNGHRAATYSSGGSVDKQALRYNTDGFKMSLNRISLINELVDDKKERFNYYLDLMYYHSNPEPAKSYWNWEMKNPSKGYSNLQIENLYDDDKEAVYSDKKYEINEDEIRELDRLLDEAGRIRGHVLFISEPYINVEGKEEIDYRASYFQKYIEDKGFDFLNMHDLRARIGVKGDEDYSMDYNHYNIHGAMKITSYLGDYIASSYGLPDRRGDARYDEWNREYEEWNTVLLNDNISWTDRLIKEYKEDHGEL